MELNICIIIIIILLNIYIHFNTFILYIFINKNNVYYIFCLFVF